MSTPSTTAPSGDETISAGLGPVRSATGPVAIGLLVGSWGTLSLIHSGDNAWILPAVLLAAACLVGLVGLLWRD